MSAMVDCLLFHSSNLSHFRHASVISCWTKHEHEKNVLNRAGPRSHRKSFNISILVGLPHLRRACSITLIVLIRVFSVLAEFDLRITSTDVRRQRHGSCTICTVNWPLPENAGESSASKVDIEYLIERRASRAISQSTCTYYWHETTTCLDCKGSSVSSDPNNLRYDSIHV
jgi:hypothetical protein